MEKKKVMVELELRVDKEGRHYLWLDPSAAKIFVSIIPRDTGTCVTTELVEFWLPGPAVAP